MPGSLSTRVLLVFSGSTITGLISRLMDNELQVHEAIARLYCLMIGSP